MSDNVIDLVQEAQKKGKFSLADAIKGRAYPEKSVDVYLDGLSAMKFAEVAEEAAKAKAGTPEHDELLAEMESLSKKIQESKLTFHMRGVGQSTVERIIKEADEKFPNSNGMDNPDWLTYYISALVASNIVKVTDADGNEDDSQFSVDEIIELRGVVPVDSWQVLVDTMQKLTLASSYFDAVTDAGFLPKS